jgi:hypothetical protein
MNCLIKNYTVKSCASKFLFLITAHCVTIHFSTQKTKKKKMIWKAKDLKVHENSYAYSNVSTTMANKIH